MIEYNKDKMVTQNDLENDFLRATKRKIKEEIKRAKQKLQYPLKFCDPNPLMKDVNYLYKEGMNSKTINHINDKAKYNNANHVAKILPSKRSMN